jgi:hypothetical protein
MRTGWQGVVLGSRDFPRRGLGGAARAAVALSGVVALLAAVLLGLAGQASAATPTWFQLSTSTSPSAREYPAMAYDPSLNKTVLFGGFDGTSALSDTWTFDGTKWTELAPATSPPARSDASMAYDSSLGKLVLFGGRSGGLGMSDTWTFDGTNWTELTPATSPPARSDASMAYDSSLGKLVLFGGAGNGSTYLGDTWTFDGTNWTELAPATSPPARSDASMAYDSSGSRLVLFGGTSGSGPLGDTWTFDGTTWAPSSATGPVARQDSGMAYDPASNEAVLFGGVGSSSFLSDTWAFDGTGWSQVETAQSPSPRSAFGITYDGNLSQIEIFGGLLNGQPLGGTYVLGDAGVPGAPGTPTAAATGSGEATLSWSAPSDTGGSPVTSYVVTPNPACPGCGGLAPSGTSTTVSGLTNGTSYTFTVAAVNVAGTGAQSGASNAVTPMGEPTVTQISPDEGPSAGGTSINVTGTGFYSDGSTTVQVGSSAATSVSCTTATSCSATTPAGSGTVDVTVTTPSGTSATGPADHFSYVPAPSVTGVSPSAGSTGGGSQIVVSGTGFYTVPGDTSVEVGGTPATDVSCSTDTACEAVTPPGKGVADVTVTTPSGTSATSPADRFAYVSAVGRYYPLTPCRILDTRSGLGSAKSPIGPRSSIDVQVSGAVPGTCANKVPALATAVVMNVTEADATSGSYLTVWPSGQSRPSASNLNFDPGRVVPNLVQVGLPGSGKVSIYNAAGSTDVVADLEGYFGPAASGSSTSGQFEPVAPTRVLDTRTSLGGHLGPLRQGETASLQVTGAQGVLPASGLSAVVLNVTVTDTTSSSYLTLWPSGQAQPLASTLNFSAGQTVPNRVVVPVGSGGKVSIYNQLGSTNLIADVAGWYTDGTDPLATGDYFTPASAPARILDTRSSLGGHQGPLGPNDSMNLPVTGSLSPVPAGADAVVANFTVTDTTASSYLGVYPGDQASPPLISDLNWPPGLTIANLVVTKLGAQSLDIYNKSGSTNVVADVEGWYSS